MLFIIIFIFSLYNINAIVAVIDFEDSLYASYPFEDYDYSAYAYDVQNTANYLIEYGNPNLEYSNIFGIGVYYEFDGDDYLKDNGNNGLIADGISLNVPKLSICTVIKTDYTAEPPNGHFTVSENGRDGFFIRWITTNIVAFRLRESTGTILELYSDRELNVTGWTLLTACWDSDNDIVRMWFNTTSVLNYTSPVLIPQIENRFELMRNQYFGYYGIGDVGFLEIYTQPVNDEWVTEKYNSVFDIDVITPSVDMSDLLFEELLFGTGFWFGLLLIISILQIVSYLAPNFSGIGGLFSLLLFVAYILNMDLDGWHTFGIILMAVNGIYLGLSSTE